MSQHFATRMVDTSYLTFLKQEEENRLLHDQLLLKDENVLGLDQTRRNDEKEMMKSDRNELQVKKNEEVLLQNEKNDQEIEIQKI